MTTGSPMVSYVFDTDSLAGLGSEMPYLDVSSQTSKMLIKDMVQKSDNIADVSRPYGFVVIGDPFLKLAN